METIILNKPVEIVINTPDTIKPDYETMGKLIDNIVILAKQDEKPLDVVGKEYSIEFVVGKKNKFKATFKCMKTKYSLLVEHIKELTKKEATRPFAVTPKEKILAKEAEERAKEQAKQAELEKKEKEKKRKIAKAKSLKPTIKEPVKKTVKTTKKQEDKWSDLD